MSQIRYYLSLGQGNITALLIAKGADVNVMDKDGKLPLKLAVEKSIITYFFYQMNFY